MPTHRSLLILNRCDGYATAADSVTLFFDIIQQRFEELKERSSMGEASVKLMKGVIKTAASRSICLVCSREFTEEERDAFIDEKEAEVQVCSLASEDHGMRDVSESARANEKRRSHGRDHRLSVISDEGAPLGLS